MGVPLNEEEQLGAQTPGSTMTDSDSEMSEFPKKKKMFSSSSFYEEPNCIYPTVEEQVEMCRKIADSLSDDCNKKSRGANMFFKRVRRAEKWVVDSDPIFENEVISEISSNVNVDPSKMPYVRVSKEPPKLKLILDPRHIIDMNWLKQEGISIVEHNTISPEVCHDIVKDLNSPTGKGAQLFAKRKKKSEEWVVDEEKVKSMLRERHGTPVDNQTLPIKPLTHPRVQMIKTPWSAAMESPVGSVDAAFREFLSSNKVADSVIRAAEAKVMTYPSPRSSILETVSSQRMENNFDRYSYPSTSASSQMVAPPSPVPSPVFRTKDDLYMSRAPRGWTGSAHYSSCASPAFDSRQHFAENAAYMTSPSPIPPLPSFQPQQQQQQFEPQPTHRLPQGSALRRTMSFADFNNKARAWSPQASQKQVKPVRPPSVLAQ